MGKESSTERSGIQTINKNPIDNNNLRKKYKNLYNIDKRDQQIIKKTQKIKKCKC